MLRRKKEDKKTVEFKSRKEILTGINLSTLSRFSVDRSHLLTASFYPEKPFYGLMTIDVINKQAQKMYTTKFLDKMF